MPATEEEMMAAFEKWAATAHPLVITLWPEAAMAVLGHLQLALRHPETEGTTAELVKEVCDELIEGIAPDAEGPLHALCMAGFNPAADEPPHG